MPRPKQERQVVLNPEVTYFKPRGVPLVHLEEVRLSVEELEALRLADLEGLSQAAGAASMGISRHTFGRVLASARRNVALALVGGQALRIEGGDWVLKAGARPGGCCGQANSRSGPSGPPPDKQAK